jgi:hypothetical protein
MPAKILGKDCGEPGRKHKKMWPVALESMLGVLGLKILLIEDDAATAKTLALRTPVQSNQQRFGNVRRISAKLLPPPSQSASPPILTVVSGKRRGVTKYSWTTARDWCADVDCGLRVSRTAAGICLLLTYGTNEHVQSWDGEFPFVVDQIALKETRNGFRILVSQRTSAEQSREQALL